MLTLIRTDSQQQDFQSLVRLLDADLAIRDGDDHAYYAQFNKTDMIRHTVVAYVEAQAVGCGAFKPFADGAVEIKRMYVRPEWRGQRIAEAILAELETWARELAMTRCVLETGHKQPEAIRLYQRSGYQCIPNYGPYAGIENSVCMQKHLIFGEA